MPSIVSDALGDVGGHHHLPAARGRGLEDALLLLVGLSAEHGEQQHWRDRVVATLSLPFLQHLSITPLHHTHLTRQLDLLLARQEHQHVARALFAVDVPHRLDRRLHVIALRCG